MHDEQTRGIGGEPWAFRKMMRKGLDLAFRDKIAVSTLSPSFFVTWGFERDEVITYFFEFSLKYGLQSGEGGIITTETCLTRTASLLVEYTLAGSKQEGNHSYLAFQSW